MKFAVQTGSTGVASTFCIQMIFKDFENNSLLLHDRSVWWEVRGNPVLSKILP